MTKTSFEYQNDKSRSSSLYNTTSFYPLTALALAACGGGGGGGGSSPTPPGPSGGGGANAPVLTVGGSQTLGLEEGTTAYSATDNSDRATGYTVTATDEDGDTVAFSVNDDRFEIVGGALLVKTGQEFDFETEPTITLTITATDNSTGALTDTETVIITVSTAPVLTVTGPQTLTLEEGTTAYSATDNSDRQTGYTFTATDEDGDTVTFSVNDDRFEIVDGALLVKTGQEFDFGAEPRITLTITATDGTLTDTETVTIDITPTAPLSGRVYDGPISGAQVYFDVNADGVQDAGDVQVATTDANGSYTISVENLATYGADTPLLAVLAGATDIGDDLTDASDDTPASGTWQAPVGSTIISPLTDFLVKADIDNARVVELLELPEGVDVTQYDPYANDADDATASAVMTASQEVAQALEQLEATGTQVTVDAVVAALERVSSEPPTDFTLTSVVDTLAEIVDGATTTERMKVADLAVEDTDTDSAEQGYILTSTNEGEADAALFEVIGAELFLIDGASLDFETNPSLDITITVAGYPSLTATHTIDITDVASAPVLAVTGSQVVRLEEVTTGAEVATGYTVLATDEDGDDTLTVTITRTDSGGNSVTDNRFLIGANGSLNIVSGSTFDFEDEDNPNGEITLTITATDGTTTVTDTADILITNIQTTPELTVGGTQREILEGTTGGQSDTGITVSATDEDGDDTVTFTITGADGNPDTRFFIENGKLRINANAEFDFEDEPSISLTITATDDSTPNPRTATQDVTITITDNPADASLPPVLEYSFNAVAPVGEGTLTDQTLTGYVFTATDEDGDDAAIVFSVDDEDRFEFVVLTNLDKNPRELRIKTGSMFDYDAAANLGGVVSVTVTATDETGLTDTETVTVQITKDFSGALGTVDVGSNAAPVFGDVDGDGDMDVLIGAADGNLRFIRWGTASDTASNPGSDWTDQTSTLSGSLDLTFSTNSAPAFGDLDGDGDDDILVGFQTGTGTSSANMLYMLWNQATSAWNLVNVLQNIPTALAPLLADTGTHAKPAFGDVDGDNDDDLVVGTADGRLLFFRWGEADGTGSGWTAVANTDAANPFNGGNTVTEGGVSLTSLAPAFGNVDNTRGDDFLLGRGDGVLSYFRDVAAGWTHISAGTRTSNPFRGFDVGDNSAPAFGDIDGDGTDDLLIGEADGTLNIWYWNDADDVWQTTSDVV